jgi:hypothetical protein
MFALRSGAGELSCTHSPAQKFARRRLVKLTQCWNDHLQNQPRCMLSPVTQGPRRQPHLCALSDLSQGREAWDLGFRVQIVGFYAVQQFAAEDFV